MNIKNCRNCESSWISMVINIDLEDPEDSECCFKCNGCGKRAPFENDPIDAARIWNVDNASTDDIDDPTIAAKLDKTLKWFLAMTSEEDQVDGDMEDQPIPWQNVSEYRPAMSGFVKAGVIKGLSEQCVPEHELAAACDQIARITNVLAAACDPTSNPLADFDAFINRFHADLGIENQSRPPRRLLWDEPDDIHADDIHAFVNTDLDENITDAKPVTTTPMAPVDAGQYPQQCKCGARGAALFNSFECSDPSCKIKTEKL